MVPAAQRTNYSASRRAAGQTAAPPADRRSPRKKWVRKARSRTAKFMSVSRARRIVDLSFHRRRRPDFRLAATGAAAASWWLRGGFAVSALVFCFWVGGFAVSAWFWLSGVTGGFAVSGFVFCFTSGFAVSAWGFAVSGLVFGFRVDSRCPWGFAVSAWGFAVSPGASRCHWGFAVSALVFCFWLTVVSWGFAVSALVSGFWGLRGVSLGFLF